jgi:hypothetical protein
MGGPGQLFTYKEHKSRNARQGEIIKRDAVRDIAAAAAADIARIIIVVRTAKARTSKKRAAKKGRRRAG